MESKDINNKDENKKEEIKKFLKELDKKKKETHTVIKGG